MTSVHQPIGSEVSVHQRIGSDDISAPTYWFLGGGGPATLVFAHVGLAFPRLPLVTEIVRLCVCARCAH
jgi:hypothetical protein